MPEAGDPPAPFRYRLEVDGFGQATFAEMSGLESGEPVEFRGGEDALANTVHKLPGGRKTGLVVLRHVVMDVAMTDWWSASIAGTVIRKRATITLVDETGRAALRWSLQGAFPIKIEGPQLNASGNDVTIESIELEHDGLSLDDDPDP